jgi:hypothetical protein
MPEDAVYGLFENMKANFFESAFFEICIKLINNTPDSDYNPEAHNVFNGKVKWCKEINDTSRYGIGVQFCKIMNRRLC